MLTFMEAKKRLASAFAPFTCTPSERLEGSLSLLFENPETGAVETFVTGIGHEQWRTESAMEKLIRELQLEMSTWSKDRLVASDLANRSSAKEESAAGTAMNGNPPDWGPSIST
ncbi:hypothetical protein D9M68_948320 [compost metagenome]